MGLLTAFLSYQPIKVLLVGIRDSFQLPIFLYSEVFGPVTFDIGDKKSASFSRGECFIQ